MAEYGADVVEEKEPMEGHKTMQTNTFIGKREGMYQQQQIGKAQIGDHLPIGDKMMQPLAVLVVEVGARCKDM